MSNGICSILSKELLHSRMQRDLSDSSLQRNIGFAFGYSIQAIEQTIGGLKKVAVNTDKISSDLDSKWEVLAEPIQEFIKSLDVISDENKSTLLELSPSVYVGFAVKIVEDEL